MTKGTWIRSFIDCRSVWVTALVVFTWASGMILFMPRGHQFLASWRGWEFQHGVRSGSVYWMVSPTTYRDRHFELRESGGPWTRRFLGFSASIQTRDIAMCSEFCCVILTAHGQVTVPFWFLLALSGYVLFFRPSQGVLRDFAGSLCKRRASSEF